VLGRPYIVSWNATRIPYDANGTRNRIRSARKHSRKRGQKYLLIIDPISELSQRRSENLLSLRVEIAVMERLPTGGLEST